MTCSFLIYFEREKMLFYKAFPLLVQFNNPQHRTGSLSWFIELHFTKSQESTQSLPSSGWGISILNQCLAWTSVGGCSLSLPKCARWYIQEEYQKICHDIWSLIWPTLLVKPWSVWKLQGTTYLCFCSLKWELKVMIQDK